MLRVKNITFGYNKTKVLKDISFTLKAGEHLSLIGESGSGKSTLLKLIYGNYDLFKGHIFWKKEEIFGPRNNLVIGYDFIKYVSQEFDLMPFTSVEENVGEFLSNFFPEEKQERIEELLDIVELTYFAKTKVKLLSGGQKQRVALARAIAKRPQLILMDEPFSHIDNFKKQSLRRNLFKHLKNNKITCIVATHDKDDVLGFADKILVLDNSKIIANNAPENLFKFPPTKLIASFFGEFNIINNKIIYAHQLKVTAHSNLRVMVKESYFKGAYYLIEAKYLNNTIRFEHSTFIKSKKHVYLKILNYS